MSDDLTRLQKAVEAARTKPGTILKLDSGKRDGRGEPIFKFYRVQRDFSLEEYGLAAAALSKRRSTKLSKARESALDSEGASPLAKAMAAQSGIFEAPGFDGHGVRAEIEIDKSRYVTTKDQVEKQLAERRARPNPNVIHR